MSDLPRVELRTAFEWTCLDCGTSQFERAQLLDSTIEEHAEIRSELFTEEEIEAGLDLNIVAAPEEVSCSQCFSKFSSFDNDIDCQF